MKVELNQGEFCGGSITKGLVCTRAVLNGVQLHEKPAGSYK